MSTTTAEIRLSVIIPTLNEAGRIADAVTRAFALAPIEVIVADGQSTDETAQVAEDAGARVILTSRGRATQQNAGADIARGEILLFQHADTWLAPVAVEQIREAIRPSHVVAGAFRQTIDAQGPLYRALEWGNGLRAGILQTPYGDQGLFVRADVFRHIGGFPEVRLMEDLLIVRRLRRKGRIALLRGPIHVDARRWQRHGVARQTLRNWSLLAAERLGVSPNRLAGFYAPHRSDEPTSGVCPSNDNRDVTGASAG